ncbi:hypothetical protein DFH09DRAFT_1278474 [Mycena vulgaris]|nr:hypothetical protein DFH09DRAFT_1278474 [Mycena vulgaris]
MDPAQRLRLVRSMRKITAVLGETPLVETTPAPTHNPNQLLAPSPGKHGFFYHASASLSSLALPFHKSDAVPAPPATAPAHDERPALFLRLPDTFEPLPPPLSPTFSPTLLSPTTPPQADARRARTRLAKVARTLGESSPARAHRLRPHLREKAPAREHAAHTRPAYDSAHDPPPDTRHSYAIPYPAPSPGAQTRREPREGWSGEWGIAGGGGGGGKNMNKLDMEDVVKGLRGLRVK